MNAVESVRYRLYTLCRRPESDHDRHKTDSRRVLVDIAHEIRHIARRGFVEDNSEKLVEGLLGNMETLKNRHAEHRERYARQKQKERRLSRDGKHIVVVDLVDKRLERSVKP